MCRITKAAFLLAFCVFVNAAEVAPGNDSSQPGLVENNSPEGKVITEEDVGELIETLESETAREELITNLKTLDKLDDKGEKDVSFSVSDALNLNDVTNRLVDDYNRILQSSGLSQSLVSKLGLLLIISLFCYAFFWFNRRLSRYLDRRADFFRDRFDFDENRFDLLFSGQRFAGTTIAFLVFVYSCLSLLSSPSGQIEFASWGVVLAEYVAVTLLLSLLVVIIWEGLNASLEYGMSSQSSLNSMRVETLLPVIRNVSLSVLILLLSLVTLSELGIDILPILAGAGVLGIAVGFGAQTMVKDFLTGFILVLEDLVQVGDVVKVGNRMGKVERITLRKIQLRSLDGVVHTVPHSEINVVDNYTKDYAYYMMDVGVAYREDTDAVISCLEKVDEAIRESDEFGDRILEPLEVLGVDQFADSAVVIKVRTKTQPHDKWLVGREFNRRIKQAFDEQNIEIPFPHRTIFLNKDNRDEVPELQAE